MNIQYENKILNYFIPVLYLHTNETISPISIKKYIDNCELCINGKKKKIQKNIFTKPEIIRENKEVLIKKGKILLPLNNFYNNIPNKYLDYCGNYSLPNQYTINQVPIYGLVQEYREFIDIIYIFNYYYYNPYKFFYIYIGEAHQSDIEFIRVRIDNKNFYNRTIPFKVLSIFYSGHSTEQGRWVKPSQIDWYNNKKNAQPIVYVAKGSHANYNKPGTWYRNFGFTNDKTVRRNALVWKPDNVINLKTRDDLMSYRGDMGNNGVHDLNRKWYNPPPDNTKGSFLYRFFYPLTKLNCFSSR
tara:strand:+ start:525 stop:1424 length:900 start_codon:yes stop_codon:yes gene_type:complete